MTTAREAQVARDAQYDALKVQVRGKVCATCDSYPTIGTKATKVDGRWQQSDWIIRCNCWPKPPTMVSAFKRETRGKV